VERAAKEAAKAAKAAAAGIYHPGIAAAAMGDHHEHIQS
jgi:hypothetical protein